MEIRELIDKLNKYRDAYYNLSNPLVDDAEYDRLYDELTKLEKETGVIYADSPTQSVGYTVLSGLEKVTHSHPMLSLDKTKSVDEVDKFIADKHSICSLKMDGLTVLLTYKNGKLVQAETRGDGTTGQLIAEAAKHIANIPLSIPIEDDLEVEGEVIIKLDDFAELRKTYDFANPRNAASGSLTLLDTKEIAKRKLSFVAWKVPSDVGMDYDDRFRYIEKLGFTVVPYTLILSNGHYMLDEIIQSMRNKAKEMNYPIDGLVFSYNDISYGESLGMTSHAPKHSIAFKFTNEEYESKLKTIEWGIGKTGILTPVAVFEPVEIDGTIVERASLHNISVMEEEVGEKPIVGETVWVVKSNEIIPQITRSEIKNNNNPTYLELPKVCPICGKPTEIKDENGIKTLWCSNDTCEGKLLNRLVHFCSKKGLDIQGLSAQTLQKLMDWGWINKVSDILGLGVHAEEWMAKDGFGYDSVSNILFAIISAMNTQGWRFISALGIPLIGSTASKQLTKQFSVEDFITKAEGDYDFTQLDNFGDEMNNAIHNFDYTEAKEMLSAFIFEEVKGVDNKLNGINFVITGSLSSYSNRDELKALIESMGGKVSGSVSKNTNYLINNDINSASAKNQKAKALNIPIITEDEFNKTFIEN